MRKNLYTKQFVQVFIFCLSALLINAQTSVFNYTGSIQTYTVPAGVTSISIEAKGAQGGSSTVATGGRGAIMKGNFAVTPGQVINILVGQQAPTIASGSFVGGGGGGGTFVVNQSNNQPLVVAGGGGGAAGQCCGVVNNGVDAVVAINGTAGINQSGGTGAGGVNGNGGGAATQGQNSGAGGGFLTDGANGAGATGGKAYLNGGAGGLNAGSNNGGFGGGGGSHYGAGGGGGGYSGGGATAGGGQWGGGGGGGSINNGTNQLNTPGANTGNGSVTITVLVTPAGALNFVKSNNTYISVPHSATLNLRAEFTIEAWVNYTGVNSTIIDKGNYNYLLQVNCNNPGFAPNRLNFYNRNTGWVNSTGIVPEGVWTHVAVTLKNGTMTFYINGVASGTAPVNVAQDNGPVNIGRQSPSTCACNIFNGNMDELRVWNRALSSCEINANKGCELSGAQNGLAAYYKFNQGVVNNNNSAVNTLTDASGNNNTGTLTNFALTGATSNWVAGQVSGTCAAYVAPNANITGNLVICSGATTQLSNSIAGGVWSSNNNAVATVNGSGLVTGVSAGTATITYTNNCGGVSTATVTVNASPAASISAVGSTTLCAGSAITLNANTGAGLTYQWLLNGNPISGATNANYIANAVGSYTVVTTQNGCSKTSNAVAIAADQTPPVAVCKDVNLVLNASGTASIIIPATTTTLLYEDWSGDNQGYYANTSTLNWNVTGDIDRADYVSGMPGIEIDLSGFGNGTIETKQTFNFTPGTYTISFLQVANTLGGNAVKVDIGSLFSQTFVTALTISSESATFTVTSNTSATLKLTQLGTSDPAGSFVGQIKLVRNEAATLAIENGSTDNCSIASITASKTNFTCADIGANTVTLTVTDVNGNVATCQATVTVSDNIAPVMSNVPSNITVNATSAAGAVVNYATPTATDNCSVAVSLTSGLASGSTFPLGNTTVTYTATDAGGNTTSRSFTVTVSGIAPVIVCPSNITVNNAAGQCGANVNFAVTEATAIPASVITYSHEPGSFFPIGTTTVTATATNAVGTRTCSFTVTVVDNIPPVFSAPPSNITVNATSAAGAVVNYTTPTATDNCSVSVSLISGLVSGATFPIGNTTVTYRATDAAGNITSQSFTVTVSGVAPVIICPANISVNSAAGQCGANVNFAATETTGIPASVITYSHIPGSFFPVGTTTVIATATNAFGTRTCSFTVTVVDNIPPVINCPPPITTTAPSNQCGVVVNYPQPTTSDNCGAGNAGLQTLTYSAQFFDYADNRFENQYSPGLPMTFVPTDGQKLAVFLVNCGSTHYMYQNITLPSSGPINLGLDMKYTNHNGSGFSNSQFIAIELRNPSTNALIATLFKTNPGAAQSTPMTRYNFDLSAYAGQQVRLQVIDATINNYYIDVQLDNITIPGSSLVNGSFETGNYSGWTIGSANSGCGTFGIGSGPSLSVVQKAGLPSGSVFPIGTTINTFEVTDLAGNKSTCSFNVTVNAPEISISGNGNEIVTGDNTPSTSDNTDLGGTIPGNSISKTYVIANNGTSALTVSSININNAAFTRSGISLPTTIQPGQTASFTVSFASMLLGVQTAVVTLNNNDCNEGAYNFTVRAEVTCTDPVFVNVNPQVIANTTATTCNAVVTYPLAVTGTPAPGLTYSFSGATSGTGVGTGSGQTFNKGTTRVIVTAVNPCKTVVAAFDVIVNDITPPIAIAQNVTIQLDANGTASINATQVNNGSTDNCGIANISIDKTTFDCSNVGSNTVVLTVTDVNGNSNTTTATVTVVDAIAPSIVAPANINQGTDAGLCGAVVNLGSPVTSDNCSIASVSSDAPAVFPVGTTIVTWTVTDVNGNTNTATQTVVVNDTEKPKIKAPALVSVVNTPGLCTATVDLGTPVTSDNCGVASVTNNAPAVFPVGTTIVTWMVTDIHGNVTDTAKQKVVVIDNDNPTISVTDISVNNDAGLCSASLNIALPITGDNCGVAAVMGVRNDNQLLTAAYPVGITTITWTVRDVNGNTRTAIQTIVVADQEKPVIACATNQVFCANTGGNTQYTIPVLTQSDNCGIASTTYTITGATNRNGTGTNASGSFAIGTSTVTFTVTDIHGNESTCSFTVTINPLPVASITTTSPDALCNQLVLTANSTLSGPFTYQWLYNNTTKATTQQLSLGLSDADGVYSVYATNANGCRSELPATYNYQKQNLVSSYTILVTKEVKLGQYNKVESGSVGVMSSRGEAEFDKYSAVTGAGSFVKAPRIDTDKGVTINSKIYGVVSVSLPTMQYNTSSTRYLQDVSVSNNTTLNGNYDDVTVKKGANVTLTGTIFGKVKLEEGASVRFTSTTLNLEELQIEKGPKAGGYSYIRFAPNTSVRVTKKVTIGSDVIVNPEAYQVTFYLADNKRDEEKFHVKGDDTRITANIILPDGKLKVTGGNYGDNKCDHRAHSSKDCKHKGHGHHDCDHRAHGDRDCRDDVFMTGLFVAEEVEGEGKNVIWNSYNCSAPAAPVTVLTSNNSQTTITEETTSFKQQATARSEEELKVTVMPNPTRTYFTLKLESKYDAPVTLRVVDASGRAVESRAKLGANSTVQIGHNYQTGNYFAEFIQGNRRKVVQLIKVK